MSFSQLSAWQKRKTFITIAEFSMKSKFFNDFYGLRQGIKWYGRALAVTPDDHLDRAFLLTRRGDALRAQFDLLPKPPSPGYLAYGKPADLLEEAVRSYRAAVKATPADHPKYMTRLSKLGASLTVRPHPAEQAEALDMDAIHAHQAAIKTTSSGRSNRAGIVTALGGWLTCILGLTLTMMSIHGLAMIREAGWTGWRDSFFIFVIVWGMLLGGGVFDSGQKLRRRARRHFSKIILFPQDLDAGSFLLYLRSFEDDPQRAKAQRVFQRGWGWPFEFLISGRSEEEQIAAALKPVGPMVAVGAPGEQLPHAGAGRMYLPYDGWQEPVRELMLRARLVVLALGPSPGTMWELCEAMRILPPERLLLIVPMRYEKYEQFRNTASMELRARAEQVRRETGEHWSPPSLPDYTSNEGMDGEIKAAIYFSSGWVPTFVHLELSSLFFGAFHELYSGLRSGLRPAFQQLASYEEQLLERKIKRYEYDMIWENKFISASLSIGLMGSATVVLGGVILTRDWQAPLPLVAAVAASLIALSRMIRGTVFPDQLPADKSEIKTGSVASIFFPALIVGMAVGTLSPSVTVPSLHIPFLMFCVSLAGFAIMSVEGTLEYCISGIVGLALSHIVATNWPDPSELSDLFPPFSYALRWLPASLSFLVSFIFTFLILKRNPGGTHGAIVALRRSPDGVLGALLLASFWPLVNQEDIGKAVSFSSVHTLLALSGLAVLRVFFGFVSFNSPQTKGRLLFAFGLLAVGIALWFKVH